MHFRTLMLVAGLLAPFAIGSPLAADSAVSPRIVSLVPSLTEDLFAIGAGNQVVGVSQFTDYPAATAKLPRISSYSSVDAEAIVKLHPDLVVGITAQASLVADLRRAGLRVVLMNNDSFEDIFADLSLLGVLSGHGRGAIALNGRLRARTAELIRSVPSGAGPRCFVVVGVAPIFTVGDKSYIAQLLRLAGARNAASGLNQAYARYSPEALVALQPDVVIADRASKIASVLDRTPWNALRAVKNKRVFVLENDDLLERPGPRYNEGLSWLIARLHSHG
jgi:ABC-type Fe3+-hydroxamate transport system substrate-binding protein